MQERYLHAAVAKLAPGVLIINTDNTYEGIVWPDGFTPPTKAALLAEIAAQSAPVDPSNLDTVTKRDKAILLAAAAMAGRTPAQAKAAYRTAWDSLP